MSILDEIKKESRKIIENFKNPEKYFDDPDIEILHDSTIEDLKNRYGLKVGMKVSIGKTISYVNVAGEVFFEEGGFMYDYEVAELIKRGNNMSENKPYTITDKRGMKEGQEHPDEVCRICGSQVVHSKQYGKSTMECITFLKNIIATLEQRIGKQNDTPVTDE